MSPTILWVLAIVLVLVGIAGTVVPALPGAPLVFVGLLLAAWADGFQKVGWLPLSILAILTVLTWVVDLLATVLGAKRLKASTLAIIGAAVGSLVGLFFGFVGLLVGPFVGALLGEYLSTRDLRQAGKVGLGTWLGMVLGAAAKLALVFTMLLVFATAYLF